jgi:hypothetical protein
MLNSNAGCVRTHVGGGDRQLGWKEEQDSGDSGVGETKQIRSPAKSVGQLKCSFRKHFPAATNVDGDGYRVAHTESYHRGRNQRVEGAA